MADLPAPSGPPELVDAALRAHGGALQRYATRLLHDPDRARDVVQDTFIALGAQPARDWRDGVRAWLFTVCRRKAINVLRKESRAERLDPAAGARLEAGGPDPAVAAERADARDRLLGLVAALPERPREVLRLRYQEGFTYEEISRITGLSATHVGVILHQAVQRLRAEWEALGRGGGSRDPR